MRADDGTSESLRGAADADELHGVPCGGADGDLVLRAMAQSREAGDRGHAGGLLDPLDGGADFEANAGEPVHVPNPDSDREEDGWIMCFVYTPEEGAFLSVLSAGDFDNGPVAKIRIPTRVPNGFHANWMQGLTLG